jgi:hypothetical protein
LPARLTRHWRLPIQELEAERGRRVQAFSWLVK